MFPTVMKYAYLYQIELYNAHLVIMIPFPYCTHRRISDLWKKTITTITTYLYTALMQLVIQDFAF